MNNAEKFKQIFGLYATELWSMPESDFLEWLNRDVETAQIDHTADIGKKVCVDTISRQAAIDAYGDWYVEEGTEEGFIGTVKQLLEGLPSAQPATNCSEIPNGSDDTISRQAALDAFGLSEKTRKYGGDHSGYNTRMLYEIQDTLESLPAAQPEIISCRDCKFAHITNDRRYCKFCDMFTDDYGQLIEMYFDSNFYCGYAERRNDEQSKSD